MYLIYCCLRKTQVHLQMFCLQHYLLNCFCLQQPIKVIFRCQQYHATGFFPAMVFILHVSLRAMDLLTSYTSFALFYFFTLSLINCLSQQVLKPRFWTDLVQTCRECTLWWKWIPLFYFIFKLKTKEIFTFNDFRNFFNSACFLTVQCWPDFFKTHLRIRHSDLLKFSR